MPNMDAAGMAAIPPAKNHSVVPYMEDPVFCIREEGEYRVPSLSARSVGSRPSDYLTPRSKAAESVSAGGKKLFWKRSLSLQTVADLTPKSPIIDHDELAEISTLGKGAFGTVKLCAYRNPQGRNIKVAVKEILPSLISNAKDLDLFLAECRLMNRLEHRSLVKFIAAGFSLDERPNLSGVEPRQLFNVQEYCDGGTLRTMVEKQMHTMTHKLKVYTPMAALEWLIQVAEGLVYLHSLNPLVIHRDLKLDNILLSSTLQDEGDENHALRAKLADFGLSKSIQAREQAGQELYRHSFSAGPVSPFPELLKEYPSLPGPKALLAPSASFNRQRIHIPTTGQIEKQLANMTGQAGSFSYMAPEVFRNEHYNEKVDIFSLAIIAYELFSGLTMSTRLMIVGSAKEFELHAIRTAEGHRLPLPSNFPDELKGVIAQMWHHDFNLRPSASKVVDLLTDLRSVMYDWHNQTKSRWSCF
mmetsp:Transcript_34342/g.61281  ORF Transcript_34342/g.61281 Transcript_34342/m.61281 type:complete len:471 (-) Transcript_34342:3072-4484(-)